MGERYYLAQLQSTGTCCVPPNPNKRRKRMAWTDEDKDKAISAYEAANPTPETSIEIVKQIAEDMDQTVNGVRMILTKAEVYIKKATTTTSANNSGSGDKPARVSKEDAQNSLKAAITTAGQTVDEDIIVKLTGKAAVYLAGIISASFTLDATDEAAE